MENSRAQKILKQIKAIEEQIDGITYMQSIIMKTIPKYSGQTNDNGLVYLDLNYEYQTADDFVGASYILTAFLCLSNQYVEQIDYHTKNICNVLEGQVDQKTMDNLYANISGRFFLPDPDFKESLYELTLGILTNKSNRFKEIYLSTHYAPKGTKYLQTIYGFIKDYWFECETISEYLDNLKVTFDTQIEVPKREILIGTQNWMKENLDVDHYRNGDLIPQVSNQKEWASLKTGAWCYYENNSENGKKYGKLYNWYAVNDPRRLAPEGYHIPTKEEFEILISAVNNDGNVLKEVGQGMEYAAGTNTSGFSALIAGYRVDDSGHFSDLGEYTDFWGSTKHGVSGAYVLGLNAFSSDIDLGIVNKEVGFSVRCLKD